MEQSYKEKYEQAIERLKQWDREHPCAGYVVSDRDKFIFPELAESEGEKVREELIKHLKEGAEGYEPAGDSSDYQRWLAWLEKQGQVKESTISQHGIETCKENNNSLTSEDEKVRKALLELVHDTIGDELWIDYNVHKEEALDWLERQGEHANFRNKIQVGDKVTRNENGVLVNLTQLKRVAKPSEKQCEQKLEIKTAEESLGIDSDTYNKIVDECILGEQKTKENKGNIGGISPNWSVEDMSKVQRICKYLNEAKKYYADITEVRECIEWLKSLKDRVQPKPMCKFGDTELTNEELCEGLIRGMVNEHNRVTKEVLRTEYEKGRADAIAEMQKEWSDVDKDILFRIIDDLKFLRDTISIDPKYAVNIIDMEREITWLKSLRPQNRWKPSELQLGCLSDAIEYYNSFGYPASKLKELLDDLKKLKEGNV